MLETFLKNPSQQVLSRYKPLITVKNNAGINTLNPTIIKDNINNKIMIKNSDNRLNTGTTNISTT